LQLTTPEIREYDTVFPSENWFFFWRTSPSLWESKLRDYKGSNPIFIPLYWGLHNENPEQFDFGTMRPETDLKRLYEVVKSVGREISFVLPITPAPFLPNGGLPSFLARNMLIDEDGLAHAVVDNDGRINKLYSFYDPRIFQSYRKYIWSLGQFFIREGIDAEVLGVDCFYLNKKNQPISFFHDNSIVFQQGFSRYLKQMQTDRNQNVEGSEDYPVLSEADQKIEYANQIKNLYKQVAEENLGGSWGGVLNYCFLGASTKDIFSRSSDLWEHYSHFFQPLFEMVVNDYVPNSALLSPKVKQSPVSQALTDIISTQFIQSHREDELYEDDYDMNLTSLIFFNLYTSVNSAMDTGFLQYIKRRYSWCYRVKKEIKFDYEEVDQKVYCFKLSEMDLSGVSSLIKYFLNGGKILVDKSNAKPELLGRFSNFFIENDIQIEKVNYVTNVEKAKLGEGVIIAYEGDKLINTPTIKRHNFWDTIINFLGIHHMDVQGDEAVYNFWKSRTSNAYELNYQEIRRLFLYNTTSYKKKVQIPNHKNFALLKTVDEKNVNMRSNTLGVEVELLPGGSVAIDYGYYE